MPANKQFTSAARRAKESGQMPEPITFDIDGETYRAVPFLPGGAVCDVAVSVLGTGPEQVKAILDYMDLALEKESAERLAKRFHDAEDPLQISDLLEYQKWLMEEFNSRPTGGSSESQSTSTPTGPASTDGAPPVALSPSPSTVPA